MFVKIGNPVSLFMLKWNSSIKCMQNKILNKVHYNHLYEKKTTIIIMSPKIIVMI